MYSISDSGKAVAGQLLKVMDDVQWNGFSYSEEFNGFLFIRDAIASNFELLMFKNLCLEDQIDGPETIINAQCFDDAAICRPYAALHLGGNFFAISLFNDIQETRPLYVIEVLGKYSYNKLQTLQASTTDKYHFFSNPSKMTKIICMHPRENTLWIMELKKPVSRSTAGVQKAKT